MTVSFTGVSNIKILKKPPVLQAVTNNRTAEQIIKRSEEMKLKFTLSNDSNGMDIDKFNAAVNKGLALSGEKVKDTTKPANISILVKHTTFPEEEFKPAETQFIVNNTLVPLNKNTDLAMYSYMGQLTRGMIKRPDLTQTQKDCINEINSYISDEAVKFIER